HLVARWRQAGLPGRRREGPTAGPVRPDSDRWRSGPGQDARGDERTAVRPGWRSAGRAFTVVTGPNDTDCFRAGAGGGLGVRADPEPDVQSGCRESEPGVVSRWEAPGVHHRDLDGLAHRRP